MTQDRSIVFGDLGRHPQLIFEALLAIPLIKVNVVSPYYKVNSSESRIRALGEEEECDLLVYLEPPSMSLVEKHRLATRAVVFTSHYTFRVSEKWVDVCFFYARDSAEGIRRMKEREDFPIRTENVDLVKANHANVMVISGKTPPADEGTYVIVDLTGFNKETLAMHLAFLDAFDYLLQVEPHRFVVCFSEHGHRAHNQFTQKVIDRVLCKRFEHGNVTDARELVSLLPFYKSHTLEKRFLPIQTSSFGGIPFIAPKTQEEACAAAVMHDVRPIVDNVFWVLS